MHHHAKGGDRSEKANSGKLGGNGDIDSEQHLLKAEQDEHVQDIDCVPELSHEAPSQFPSLPGVYFRLATRL